MTIRQRVEAKLAAVRLEVPALELKALLDEKWVRADAENQ